MPRTPKTRVVDVGPKAWQAIGAYGAAPQECIEVHAENLPGVYVDERGPCCAHCDADLGVPAGGAMDGEIDWGSYTDPTMDPRNTEGVI